MQETSAGSGIKEVHKCQLLILLLLWEDGVTSTDVIHYKLSDMGFAKLDVVWSLEELSALPDGRWVVRSHTHDGWVLTEAAKRSFVPLELW